MACIFKENGIFNNLFCWQSCVGSPHRLKLMTDLDIVSNSIDNKKCYVGHTYFFELVW